MCIRDSHFTLFGWLLFRATRRIVTPDGSKDDSFNQICEFLAAPSRGLGLTGEAFEYLAQLAFYTLPLIVIQCFQWWSKDHYIVLRWPTPARAVAYALLLFTWVFFGAQVGTAFIYFQF